jgi:GR25 family glycosyltransferase involved in LPS biosynthesis
MFWFIVFTCFYILFMILLGVVLIPEDNSSGFVQNNETLKYIREIVHRQLHVTKNGVVTLKSEEKIGMPIYFINLERSMDRKNHMLQELQSAGLSKLATRIDGVDGKNMISTESGTLNEVTYRNSFPNMAPEICCTLSHLKAIKTAYDEGLEEVLIVEDDVMFTLLPLWTKTLPELMQDLADVEPEWRVMILFDLKMEEDANAKEISFKPYSPFCGTAAYVINRHGMKFCLDRVYNALTNEFLLDKKYCDDVRADKFIYEVTGKAFTLTKGLMYTSNLESLIGHDLNRANMFSNKVLKQYKL